MFLWGFWWMRHAVEHLQWPLSADYAMAPHGGVLIFNGMELSALVSVPVQWLFGTALAYNLLAIAVVLLAGVATYALARDIGLRRPAAFIASFLFVAGPQLAFRYGNGHLNLAHAFWIPLLLLLLRRYLRQPTVLRAAVGAAGVAGALYSDFTIAIFAGMLCAAYVAGLACLHPIHLRRAARLWPILAGGLVVGILLVPLGVAIGDAARQGALGSAGLGGSPGYSNDLMTLLVPNLRIEGPGDLGLGATLLAAAGLVLHGTRSRIVIWLTIAAVACAVLSLGPQLLLAGARHVPFQVHIHGDAEPVSAIMPYTWVQAIFQDLRVPQRFLLLGSLPLALLAGFGVEALAARSRNVTIVAVVIASALVLAEAHRPVAVSIVAAMPAEYQAVAGDPDSNAIVVDVPLGFRTGFFQLGRQTGPPLIYATQHQKPVATGFFTRMSENGIRDLAAIALYRDLLALQDVPLTSQAPPTNASEGHAAAVAYNLKYVVIHKDVPGAASVRVYLRDACYRLVGRGAVEVYRLGACTR